MSAHGRSWYVPPHLYSCWAAAVPANAVDTSAAASLLVAIRTISPLRIAALPLVPSSIAQRAWAAARHRRPCRFGASAAPVFLRARGIPARRHTAASKETCMDPAVRRQTLSDLLHRTARRLPSKAGLVCGPVQWTFAEFDAVVDRVAVLARNSHAFAALRFALARLGAVLVPINFMLQAQEVAYILRHAQVQTLDTDSGLALLAQAAS